MINPVIDQHEEAPRSGVWIVIGTELLAPENITLNELKCYLKVYGGAICLREDGRFIWIPITRGPC